MEEQLPVIFSLQTPQLSKTLPRLSHFEQFTQERLSETCFKIEFPELPPIFPDQQEDHEKIKQHLISTSPSCSGTLTSSSQLLQIEQEYTRDTVIDIEWQEQSAAQPKLQDDHQQIEKGLKNTASSHAIGKLSNPSKLLEFNQEGVCDTSVDMDVLELSLTSSDLEEVQLIKNESRPAVPPCTIGSGGPELLPFFRFLKFYSDGFVTRPVHMQLSKKGNIGREIKLQTNFFKIQTAPDWFLFVYKVDFTPDESKIIVRKNLLRQHHGKLGPYLSDGIVIYTPNQYENVTDTNPMQLYSEKRSDGTQIEISIRLYYKMKRGDAPYLEFLNILTRNILVLLRLKSIEKCYCDSKPIIKIPEYLFELWCGYHASISPCESNLLMNIDVTCKIMRHETVLDIINKIRKKNRFTFVDTCKKEIIGLTVFTPCNNLSYQIMDIDFTLTPSSKFTLKKDDCEMTYLQYYKEKYNICIVDVAQPLLVTCTDPPRDIFSEDYEKTLRLVPELCKATGITETMKNWPWIMNTLNAHANPAPKVRMNKLLAFNRRLQEVAAVIRELQQWNLKLDNKLVEVSARILPSEKIRFNKKLISVGGEGDWTQSFIESNPYLSPKLDNWVLIFPNGLKEPVKKFVDMLIDISRCIKSFNIKDPTTIELSSKYPKAKEYSTELEKILNRPNLQLVFSVIMEENSEAYSAIKRLCCLDKEPHKTKMPLPNARFKERPVACQVILRKQLNNPDLRSIVSQLGIQLKAKIGGVPWTVNFKHAGLMVVGYARCEDSKNHNITYGAMVASLDHYMTRYFSAVSTDDDQGFCMNMVAAVEKYVEINKKYPSCIIIYRNGVDNGFIPFICKYKLKYLRETLEKLYAKRKGPKEVKFAYIITTRHNNVKLFYNGSNPPLGTVVDDVITNLSRYDFYLVSAHVKNGCVSPTAYNVIYDNTGFDVSTIQQLTYKLTHMYFNWSRIIRVPAPCQYAYKLAVLVAQHLHSIPSKRLETSLYYL